jgi:ribosomal protein L7Ae-like RNA K-turn-binding protein
LKALNGVKADRAKLVLLSPDTEESDALDDKIDYLIELALAKEIPILYCLNRRKLGKAVNLTTRQSAVAIYDPSGAYDHFKKIKNYFIVEIKSIARKQVEINMKMA